MRSATLPALVLAALTLSPVFAPLADPASAQSTFVPPPSRDNSPPGPGDLDDFAQGSAAAGGVVVAENADGSVLRLFYEDFESGCAGLPAGWTEEVAPGRTAGWHRDCYSSAAFASGQATAIVHTGTGSASLRTSDGGYPARIDTRLVSPEIDLRWVSGRAQEPDALTDTEFCSAPEALDAQLAEQCRAFTGDGTSVLPFSRDSLHAFASDLQGTFAGFGSSTIIPLRPLRAGAYLVPDDASDLPLTPEALGFGLVNLTFYHAWDWKTNDGGLVEIRYEEADGTWSSWANLEGDLVFETEVPWADAIQESGCAPWVIASGAAGLGSEAIVTRNLLPAICGGFSYWQDPCVTPQTSPACPSRLLTDDSSGDAGVVEADLAEPGLSFSGLYSRFVDNQDVRGPNGRIDLDGSSAPSPTPNPEGYVSESDGMRFSKYTLNRFIGHRIQVAFRAVSHSESPPIDRGWFVDDVAVSALVPTKDVGVAEILAPRDGDLLKTSNSALTPRAVVKNFGREKTERVHVSFEIRATDGTGRTWGPFESPAVLTLEPLEERVVSTRQIWSVGEPGTFELRVRTWIDAAVTPGGPTGTPQTDVVGGNDELVTSFAALDIRRASVDVRVDPGSSVTDIGGTKTGIVRLANTGNVNVSGVVRVFYDRVDAETLPVERRNTLVEIRPAASIAIPHGRNTSIYGSDVNWVDVPWTWTQRTSPTDPTPVDSGIYAIVAVFTPSTQDTALGVREVDELVFVRATPPPVVSEAFPLPASGSTIYPVRPTSSPVETLGADGAGSWTPRGYVRPVVSGANPNDVYFLPTRPTPMDGSAYWVATGEDCHLATHAPCIGSGQSNVLDWYVLRKDLTLEPAVTSIKTEFATAARFNFTQIDAENRTRGFLRIYPQMLATDDANLRTAADDVGIAYDALRAAGDSLGVTRGISGAVVSQTITPFSCRAEDGTAVVGRKERVTMSTDRGLFNVTSVVFETAHDWRKCEVEVLLSDVGSHAVAVEWVFETNRTRLATAPRRPTTTPTSDFWCMDPATVVATAVTCPLVAPDIYDPWYVDDMRITPFAGATARTPQPTLSTVDGSTAPSYFNCQFVGAGNRDANCRGWTVAGVVSAPAVPNVYPANWYIEKFANDRDGSGSVLRYGALGPSATPTDTDKFGTSDGDSNGKLVLSTLRSPTFDLAGYYQPSLSFWTKFKTNPCSRMWDSDRGIVRGMDGFSVWIVGIKDGAQVATSLLVPDVGYNNRTWAADGPKKGSSGCLVEGDLLLKSLHPFAAQYDATSGNNSWSGTSNPDSEGAPQWMKAVFDLSPYAGPEYAGVAWSIELRAVAQSLYSQRAGYWRVDNLHVEDRIAANDVGIAEIVLSPATTLVGPGQRVAVSTVVANAGLFDQRGVVVEHEIRNDRGEIVNLSVYPSKASFDSDRALTGLLAGSGEREAVLTFPRTWTPTIEGEYTLTVRTRLDESVGSYVDSNPANDEKTITILVQAIHSLRLPQITSLPDDALVTPLIGGAGEPRTFRITVENDGTMPAIFEEADFGKLRLVVTVRDESNATILSLESPIPKIDPGKSVPLEFRNAWIPSGSGLYTIDFTLVVDREGGDVSTADNLRRLKVIVFNRIVPASGETWSEVFEATGDWRQDAERTGADGWTFGGPYPNNAEGALEIKDLLNLRSVRNLFLVLDHRYAFEEGYDAGLVEVSPDGGITWIPLPPRGGYETVLSTASPLVEDPFHPVSALSGASGGYTTLDLNLGSVPELRTFAEIFAADLTTQNPFAARGTGCGVPQGETMPPATCLSVSPASGTGMWFSDKYALLCTRAFTIGVYNATSGNQVNSYTHPTAGSISLSEAATAVTFPGTVAWDTVGQRAFRPWGGRSFSFGEEGCRAPWTGVIYEESWTPPNQNLPLKVRWTLRAPSADGMADVNTGPLLETEKVLAFPITVPAFATKLELSYRDWRAIGSTVQKRGTNGNFAYTSLAESNAVEVAVCCDEEGNEYDPILPADRTSASDNYRDWTLNRLSLESLLDRIAGRTVEIRFRHYVATGFPAENFGGNTLSFADPGDSDFLSPHIGWAIDDIAVQWDDPTAPLLVNAADSAGDLGEAGFKYKSICHQATTERQGAVACPRTLGPEDAGFVGWQLRDATRLPAPRVGGRVLGEQVWTVENGALVAQPSYRRTLSNLNADLPAGLGRVTGDQSRLILPLDLKSAVDDVRLEFDSAWKLSKFANIEGNFPAAYAGSGARVEVSVDGGASWIPVEPQAQIQNSHQRMLCRTPRASTHSLLAGYAGDPQGNSPFGTCATGVLSDLSTNYVAGAKVHLVYDLTDFAGRDVLLGFHVAFASNREVAGTKFPGGPLPDRWLLDNLRVTAAILDAKDISIRLRAASDGSTTDDGWDVRGLTLLGVKHTQNTGVRVEAPGQDGLLGKGDAAFVVEAFNKGQTISEGVVLVAWVNATDSAGVANADYSRVFGPGPLSAWKACSAKDGSAIDPAGRLSPESSARLCEGPTGELKFPADPRFGYTITARIVDSAYAFDNVKADNRATTSIPIGSVVEGARLRILSATASPNAFSGAGTTLVSVPVENYGFARSELTLGSPSLRLVAPDGSASALEPDTVPLTQFGPLQRATFNWTLDASDLDRARGTGVWSAVVTVASRAGSVDTRTVTIYVGTSVLADLGFVERVHPVPMDDSTRTDQWLERHDWCMGTSDAWKVTGPATSGGYYNKSAYYAFTLPRQPVPPSSLGGGDGGQATPNACDPPKFYNSLRTPMMSVRGTLGPDGLEHEYLTFWTRNSFTLGSYAQVEVFLLGSDGRVVPSTPALTAPPGGANSTWVHRLTGESAGFSLGNFEPVTVDLLQGIRNYVNPYRATQQAAVRNAAFTHILVAFVQYGPSENPWQVDEVAISPLGAKIGSSQSYTTADDTDKEYRFVVENSGSYTDSFALNLVQPPGQARIVPLGWHVVLLDSKNRVLWHDGPTLTPAPPGCNPIPPGPSGAVELADSFVLDPGEKETVRLKVCIPISESQAGRSAATRFVLEVTNVGNPYGASRATLDLAYAYSERANLLIPASGVRIDNPELPVDQPRAVTVTVQNAGAISARDVRVRVYDTMDSRYGYAPVELTGLNGLAVPDVDAIPTRGDVRFTFLWTPRAVGEHNLTVVLDPADVVRELRETDNRLTIPLRIGRAEYPDLVVTLLSERAEPARGAPNAVDLSITNVGGRAALGVQLTFGAGVTDFLRHEGSAANDFIDRIEPGATVTRRHAWTPAFAGNITLYATAYPRSGVLEPAASHGDNVVFVPVLVRATDVSVAPRIAVVSAIPGGEVRVPLTVAAAETADNLVLSAQAPGGSVPVFFRGALRTTNVSLAARQNASLELVVTLPQKITAGDHTLNISVRSRFSSATATTSVVLRVLPVHALLVEAAPLKASAGAVTVPVTVLNEGNARDIVDLLAPSLPAGWTAEAKNATVAPYSRATVGFVLNVPGSTPAGVYEVFLVAKDAATESNATLLLEVAEQERLQPVAGALPVVRPGQVVETTVRVTNLGNVRGEASLLAKAPPGWTARLGRGLVALDVGESTTVPLTVTLPRNATSGPHDLSIEATGLTSNRSTVVRLDVVQSDLKVADLTFTPRVNVAPGTVVTLNASIVTDGLAARNATVAFYADDYLVGVQKLAVIDRNGTFVVLRWIAQPGEHVLLVLLDPGNVLEETDEANNARIEVLRVAGTEGILAAARNAVPGPGLWAGLGAILAVAVAAARARRGRT